MISTPKRSFDAELSGLAYGEADLPAPAQGAC
jgi:hypothetical protein